MVGMDLRSHELIELEKELEEAVEAMTNNPFETEYDDKIEALINEISVRFIQEQVLH